MIIPVSKQGTKADGSKYSYNQTEMCDLIVNEDTWDVTLGAQIGVFPNYSYDHGILPI